MNAKLEMLGALLSINFSFMHARGNLQVAEPLQYVRYLQANYLIAAPEFQPLQSKRLGKKEP
jgi:hypothetical protein